MKPRQMKTILRLASIALACAFSAPAPGMDVDTTWDKAVVFVPGSVGKTTPDKVAVNNPLPVVIYLHGCTGINPRHDEGWGDFIRGLGYVAVLPDSMARPGRRSNCDAKTKSGGYFLQANEMRLEEIGYALEQVKKSAWADTNNVYLMGHSEGGTAAARTKLAGFRGIIISGWTCTDKFGKRKKARQVLFSGSQHGTYGQQEARDALAQFLKENLSLK